LAETPLYGTATEVLPQYDQPPEVPDVGVVEPSLVDAYDVDPDDEEDSDGDADASSDPEEDKPGDGGGSGVLPISAEPADERPAVARHTWANSRHQTTGTLPVVLPSPCLSDPNWRVGRIRALMATANRLRSEVLARPTVKVTRAGQKLDRRKPVWRQMAARVRAWGADRWEAMQWDRTPTWDVRRLAAFRLGLEGCHHWGAVPGTDTQQQQKQSGVSELLRAA
jgi:hypothetical protein